VKLLIPRNLKHTKGGPKDRYLSFVEQEDRLERCGKGGEKEVTGSQEEGVVRKNCLVRIWVAQQI